MMDECTICHKTVDVKKIKVLSNPFQDLKLEHVCDECWIKYLMSFDMWVAACRQQPGATMLADAIIR